MVMQEIYRAFERGESFYLLNDIDGRAIRLFEKDGKMRATAKGPKGQEYTVDASANVVMTAIHGGKSMTEQAYHSF